VVGDLILQSSKAAKGASIRTFHLPMEAGAALLDMARTSINVLGNCLASAVVARWEGYKVG
jgi:proton glutamate symport protein